VLARQFVRGAGVGITFRHGGHARHDGFYFLALPESLAEATKLAEGAPFLQNNPKGQVVVRPIMQM